MSPPGHREFLLQGEEIILCFLLPARERGASSCQKTAVPARDCTGQHVCDPGAPGMALAGCSGVMEEGEGSWDAQDRPV